MGPVGKKKRLLVVGNGMLIVNETNEFLVNRHTADFLSDLEEYGYAVSYADIKVSGTSNGSLNDAPLESTGVKVHGLVKKSLLDKVSLLRSIIRSDYVYAFFPGTLSRYVLKLCRLIRKPYGIYLRGEQFLLSGSDSVLISDADCVFSVAGVGERVRGITERMFYIRPMLDIVLSDHYRRDIPRVRQHRWHLLFVGRLVKAKGVEELIQAAQILADHGFSYELTVVGGGPLYDQLSRELCEGRALPVRLVGHVADRDKLFPLYESADILVLPTHHEGFPRVLYEAMCKSMVIVTTFVGGISHLMKSDQNCIEIAVNDPEGMAKKILDLTGDIDKMQKLSDAAYQTGIDYLSKHPQHASALHNRLLSET